MACSAHYLRGGRGGSGGGWGGGGGVSELYLTISSGLAGSVVPTVKTSSRCVVYIN